MTERREDVEKHFPDEATPGEVPEQAVPAPDLGLHDRGWSQEQWQHLLETLVESGISS